jgi:hypothetical protein
VESIELERWRRREERERSTEESRETRLAGPVEVERKEYRSATRESESGGGSLEEAVPPEMETRSWSSERRTESGC